MELDAGGVRVTRTWPLRRTGPLPRHAVRKGLRRRSERTAFMAAFVAAIMAALVIVRRVREDLKGSER